MIVIARKCEDCGRIVGPWVNVCPNVRCYSLKLKNLFKKDEE